MRLSTVAILAIAALPFASPSHAAPFSGAAIAQETPNIIQVDRRCGPGAHFVPGHHIRPGVWVRGRCVAHRYHRHYYHRY